MKKLEKIAKQGKIDEDASLTDRQSIIINAPIQAVWNTITSVSRWSEWNEHVTEIEGNPTSVGESFSWVHHGKKIQSTLEVSTAPSLFVFVGKAGFAKSIYLWSLDKTDENQTVVTIEQSLKGFLLFLFMNHGTLHQNLLNWLDQLKVACEKESALV